MELFDGGYLKNGDFSSNCGDSSLRLTSEMSRVSLCSSPSYSFSSTSYAREKDAFSLSKEYSLGRVKKKKAEGSEITYPKSEKIKKIDPNEPKKPLSAYAQFFKDCQKKIKGQNPKATFKDVTKTVSTMWDSLDKAVKSQYKSNYAVQMKDYFEALQEYELKTEEGREARKDSEVTTVNEIDEDVQSSQSEASSNVTFTSFSFPKNEPSKDVVVSPICIRSGCLNFAVDDPNWDREYCSSKCLVSHCKEVFNNWVTKREEEADI